MSVTNVNQILWWMLNSKKFKHVPSMQIKNFFHRFDLFDDMLDLSHNGHSESIVRMFFMLHHRTNIGSVIKESTWVVSSWPQNNIIPWLPGCENVTNKVIFKMLSWWVFFVYQMFGVDFPINTPKSLIFFKFFWGTKILRLLPPFFLAALLLLFLPSLWHYFHARNLIVARNNAPPILRMCVLRYIANLLFRCFRFWITSSVLYFVLFFLVWAIIFIPFNREWFQGPQLIFHINIYKYFIVIRDHVWIIRWVKWSLKILVISSYEECCPFSWRKRLWQIWIETNLKNKSVWIFLKLFFSGNPHNIWKFLEVRAPEGFIVFFVHRSTFSFLSLSLLKFNFLELLFVQGVFVVFLAHN